ncbi:response regulator [Rhodococcus sp. X156]|uniref:response regulator n=1 Tax=Rhodococcus sp. X156 TaxID=2499145 RepID=UPI000FD70196|nr:response regulator [Rhodococcus sp. X156]
MRVLVADDSTVMRRIVVRTLRQAGIECTEVLEAANGAEAYEVALAEEPDLVLSDWNMPGMSGLDALRALRAAGSRVRFGFVTSESSDEMRAAATAAGAAFLIVKPFTPENFRDALEPA